MHLTLWSGSGRELMQSGVQMYPICALLRVLGLYYNCETASPLGTSKPQQGRQKTRGNGRGNVGDLPAIATGAFNAASVPIATHGRCGIAVVV